MLLATLNHRHHMFELDPQLSADTIELGDLPISKVLLMNDHQFPWIILVPRRADITELYELSDADIEHVQNESLVISKFMMEHFKGDKLNVAALGNVVSQLHIHHVVRFENDIAWPKPVWGNFKAAPYLPPEGPALVGSLKRLISGRIPEFMPN